MVKLKEVLKKKLTKKELSLLKTSYDVVGDIAIVEIPYGLGKKEKSIADTILKEHKNINVVCKKVGIHSGKFRLQKLKIIGGEKRKETIHKENNAQLKLNPEDVYFSVRSGTERKRIASLVKKGEEVLVMFSGVAPFPIVISKNSNASKIYAVELNKKAHKYALENLKLNRIKNVELFQGDVRKLVPKLYKVFDRIIMPLPKSAETYLDVALKVSRKGTMIHLYVFLQENEITEMKDKIKDMCKANAKDVKIIHVEKCGQYSPYTYRMCFDIRVL
jgi:tRNA (guanine37-N1)-methyltransferase